MSRESRGGWAGRRIPSKLGRNPSQLEQGNTGKHGEVSEANLVRFVGTWDGLEGLGKGTVGSLDVTFTVLFGYVLRLIFGVGLICTLTYARYSAFGTV